MSIETQVELIKQGVATLTVEVARLALAVDSQTKITTQAAIDRARFDTLLEQRVISAHQRIDGIQPVVEGFTKQLPELVTKAELTTSEKTVTDKMAAVEKSLEDLPTIRRILTWIASIATAAIIAIIGGFISGKISLVIH